MHLKYPPRRTWLQNDLCLQDWKYEIIEVSDVWLVYKTNNKTSSILFCFHERLDRVFIWLGLGNQTNERPTSFVARGLQVSFQFGYLGLFTHSMAPRPWKGLMGKVANIGWDHGRLVGGCPIRAHHPSHPSNHPPGNLLPLMLLLPRGFRLNQCSKLDLSYLAQTKRCFVCTFHSII